MKKILMNDKKTIFTVECDRVAISYCHFVS